MRSISIAMPPYSMAVDKQQLAFKPLNDKITRSLNFYKACLANPDDINTAKTLADKIRGFSNSKKTDVDPAKTKTISRSQLSYDSRIENFTQYIDVLRLSGVYVNPSNGIEIVDLNILLKDLEDTNHKVAENKLPLDMTRNTRDLIFYAPKTGIADLVLGVKSYVKAILNKNNAYYDDINSFSFRKR